MAEKPIDDGENEPSLELPKFRIPGLGRRKQSAPQDAPRADEPGEAAHTQSASEPAAPSAPATRVETDEGQGRRTKKSDGFSMPSLPAVPGPVAAIVTGLVVGAFGTWLTYLAMAGCEWIRGASTCGRSGFFMLVAILILMVLLGGMMLRIAKVSDTTGTSFLAVALLCVIGLLTLTDVIFSGWMFLVVPILSAAAYALSHWVTSRFAEETDTAEGSHDAR